MPGQFARQKQRHPSAHRGADYHLRAVAELIEDRDAFLQPSPDGALGEVPAGFTVAGIVEPDAGAVALGRPCIERQRLGPLHVRFEAAEPEKPGRCAVADADRNTARRACLADIDKHRDLRVGCGADHAMVMRERVGAVNQMPGPNPTSRVMCRLQKAPLRPMSPARHAFPWPKCLAFDAFSHPEACWLAREALFLQTTTFVHNFGETPIRRPNRAPPVVAKDGPRTNDEIRNATVQLIDQNGANQGTVETIVAIKQAIEAGMDLVEISPNAVPPVCKIMDYGKYKYSAQKKAAEARKKQKTVEIKEIKLRPMIDDHDYDVKMRAMQRFFEEGDKVKITLRYRGREMAHQEIGTKLLDKIKTDVADFAKVEQDARFEGRQVVMVLAPR
jgi:translation initiation factor IF-3